MKKDDVIDIQVENQNNLHNFESELKTSEPKRTKYFGKVLIGLLIVALLMGRKAITFYVELLWFDSLGYKNIFLTEFKYQLILFSVFLIGTILLVKIPFWLLQKTIGLNRLQPNSFVINGQVLSISPVPFIRIISWAIALILGIAYGSNMASSWKSYALWMHKVPSKILDPVWGRSLSYYLFDFPLQVELADWLWVLAFISFVSSIAISILVKLQSSFENKNFYRGISFSFAGLLATWIWKVYLERFAFLFNEHQIFSGISYTDAHIQLPGLNIILVCLGIGVILSLLNSFSGKKFRLLILAGALPVAAFFITQGIVPSYVANFIVKPNQLARETPYIEMNIEATRHAFKLSEIQEKSFDIEVTPTVNDLKDNQSLDNVQLWDWHALQATLRQMQEIRTYYDFPDVDIDRYKVNGQTRQMMLASRELSVDKLPESSRTWINEKLIYTHGYGITMNPANQFTSEGQPNLLLSNMPVESSSPDIKITKPEIYFGELTKTNVYVNTRQKEFNFPQGDTNNSITYAGSGGIIVGSGLRRLCLALELGDISKLPFSDDITPESRLLMKRTITERVHALTPYLFFDEDPYIILGEDGKLYWMMDGFTNSEYYPYSSHINIEGLDNPVNYFRNSVKVVVDAYEGTVNYYIADPDDPIIQSYRNIFPEVFKDFDAMPKMLQAHLRFSEKMLAVQGQLYSLYHMNDPQVFYNREDLWNVATELNTKQEVAQMNPHFGLMKLPNEENLEFINSLVFTPSNRNNLIALMVGRSDAPHYGETLVYTFPKTKLVDGPQQIESRIDQNAQLSGQLTLWNQQGSSVLRGHMVVVPIGKSLLYVEPIYLQASKSPMPELRLVVLATGDHLVYGINFEEALANLTRVLTNKESIAQEKENPSASESISNNKSIPGTQEQLIKQAAADLKEYQNLTAQGNLAEAGKKLEAVKAALEELNKGVK